MVILESSRFPTIIVLLDLLVLMDDHLIHEVDLPLHDVLASWT